MLKKKGYTLRDIAFALGRAVSTICDELKRNKNKMGVYDPKIAAQKAYVRRKYAKFQGMKIVEHPALRIFVEAGLKEGRSPESIAGRICTQEKDLPYISGDSIERFLKSVHGRKIEALRVKQKWKRKHRKKRLRSGVLDGRRFIDKRPQRITRRERVGDIEADFIVSGRDGKGILLTVVDRKLRVSFIEQILMVTIKNVHRAFARIKKRYPELQSITTDNDLLFKYHRLLEEELSVKIYFCHPYHSWEKGTIENTNGVIRHDIPKGSDISRYSKKFVRAVERKVNARYMKCLRFKSPNEALMLYRKRKKAHQMRKKKK